MRFMKAVFFVPFFLFFLGPVNLGISTDTSLSTFEKTSTPSMALVQAAPRHQEVAIEFENETEEGTSDLHLTTKLVSLFEQTAPIYINVFNILPTSLWNPVLQFCSLLTSSPPLS